MKYKVTGINRQTGARMILEMDAANRAAAEREASHSLMGEVLHCEQVLDPDAPAVERKTHRGEFNDEAPAARKWLVLVVLLVLLLVSAVVFWPRLAALFGG